jgi:hypothetical protein
LPLGVQEEHHQRQIVIEFKKIEVLVIDARQADAHELIREVLDALQTDNLPVELSAGASRHTAHHYHQGLAALPRLRFAFLETENPALLARRLVPAPHAAALTLAAHGPLLRRQPGVWNNEQQSQEHEAASHERISEGSPSVWHVPAIVNPAYRHW